MKIIDTEAGTHHGEPVIIELIQDDFGLYQVEAKIRGCAPRTLFISPSPTAFISTGRGWLDFQRKQYNPQVFS